MIQAPRDRAYLPVVYLPRYSDPGYIEATVVWSKTTVDAGHARYVPRFKDRCMVCRMSVRVYDTCCVLKMNDICAWWHAIPRGFGVRLKCSWFVCRGFLGA